MVTCGHEIPDDPKTSFKALNGKLQDNWKTYQFELTRDNQVIGELGTGKWTMVYDEGWEIDYGGMKFVNFFKYWKRELSLFYKTDCHKTLVGWYNDYKQLQKGCSQAQKVEGNNQSFRFIQMESRIQKQHKLKNQQIKFNTEQQQQADLHKTVERINSTKNLKWKAKVYDNFTQLSMKQLNTYAGRQKKKIFQKQNSLFIQTKAKVQEEEQQATQQQNIQDNSLPKNFSWKDKVPKTIEQQNCGGCYAIATAQMLSARNRIKTGEDTVLSAQHAISCSYYNQGCEGGYSVLVSKFANEYEMVPESCHPYQASNSNCDTCNISTLEYIYKVTDYGYIGGAYGKSNELLMMQEIYKNGPIVVSFEPDYEFMSYSSGIYKSLKKTERNDDWNKVDHSVLCVGWGEDEENGKYWIVQNSWGEGWGENGYFKIERGTNEANIETMGEFAIVEKIKNVLYQQ